MQYKAVTVCQPWASLIACGAKRFETRGWKTNYRGPIFIHTGNASPESVIHERETQIAMYNALKPFFYPDKMANWSDIEWACPLGGIVAVANLVDVWQTDIVWPHNLVTLKNKNKTSFDIRPPETLFGDYSLGRYAFELADVVAFPHIIPCPGKLNLWNCSSVIQKAYDESPEARGLLQNIF